MRVCRCRACVPLQGRWQYYVKAFFAGVVNCDNSRSPNNLTPRHFGFRRVNFTRESALRAVGTVPPRALSRKELASIGRCRRTLPRKQCVRFGFFIPSSLIYSEKETSCLVSGLREPILAEVAAGPLPAFRFTGTPPPAWEVLPLSRAIPSSAVSGVPEPRWSMGE